jgi:predicted flap endonuclease-1-like 5' DNA nuclease
MAERFTADLLFILIVLLIAALVGFLIGYLLRRPKKVPCPECPELEKEISDLKLKISQLESEAGKTAVFAFNPGKAKEILGFKVIEDDLKIVEGIGPKISDILKRRGITTWKALSGADPKLLKQYLLEDGGELYRINIPDTWPHQARLAHEGKWDELSILQKTLTGGKEV